LNTTQAPRVELVDEAPHNGGSGRRWKIFIIVLLLASLVGAIAVYSRAPTYRAHASVLTIKPAQPGAYSARANAEHAEIQKRLLLGEELLSLLASQLNQDGFDVQSDQLLGILSVAPVPDTNLLELRAEGGDPATLQAVANQWAKSYESYRLQQIETETGRVTDELKDRQQQLQEKITAAREQLREFRKANAIVGLERGENRAMATLKGLNQSLNKARQDLVEAEAKQAAIAVARKRGKTIVPDSQKARIANLRLEARKTRSRLKELRRQFTQTYIDRDPKLRELPKQLQRQERELAEALSLAAGTLDEETTQQIESARLSVEALERKLNQQQANVELFNERYEQFKALNSNLTRLRGLLAEQKEQLVRIEIKNQQKFPPIEIVELARLPSSPIHPNYTRDMGIALGIAFTLALFLTWLVEYLSGRPKTREPQFGVNIYTGDGSAQALPGGAAQAQLGSAPNAPLAPPPAALSAPQLPRELEQREVTRLLAEMAPQLQGYAALLLSGVSPYELALLTSSDFDSKTHSINLGGANPRQIQTDANIWQRIAATGLFTYDVTMPLQQVEQQLSLAAEQAQLESPESINALALWHSYVMYLVRQGIDSESLAARVGAIPPSVLEELMRQSPGGKTTNINPTYPVL